jgi:DNA-binding protein H-NS
MADKPFDMPKTLNQIRAQIAKLQREEEAMRAKEIAGVVARIQDAIAHYGLTPADLFGTGAVAKKRGAAKPAGATKKAPSPAKYRDDAGHTWSGHGKRPNWFKAALAAGKTAQDMEIKN